MSSDQSLKNNYHLLEEIGRGRFGTITRCFSPSKNAFFACKTVDKTLLLDPTDRECLEKEPKIMSLVSPHPNILQIFDVYETDDSLSIILDLCQTFTLYDLLLKDVTLSESKSASIMRQLLSAIAHCHRYGVVHRDIKPENVLFDARNRVKLADFGSADMLGGEEEGRSGGDGLSGVVGTPYYVAPEVVLGRVYNEKVDVWSAGVVLYVMLGGIVPFYGESVEEIFQAVVRGNLRFPPRIFREVSAEAKDLLRKMICRDVSRRISAEQALRHPWILNGGETISVD